MPTISILQKFKEALRKKRKATMQSIDTQNSPLFVQSFVLTNILSHASELNTYEKYTDWSMQCSSRASVSGKINVLCNIQKVGQN